jgi:hypothetical protein
MSFFEQKQKELQVRRSQEFTLRKESDNVYRKMDPHQIIDEYFPKFTPDPKFLSEKEIRQLKSAILMKYADTVLEYNAELDLLHQLQKDWEEQPEDKKQKVLNVKAGNSKAIIKNPDIAEAAVAYDAFYSKLGNMDQHKDMIEFAMEKITLLDALEKRAGRKLTFWQRIFGS